MTYCQSQMMKMLHQHYSACQRSTLRKLLQPHRVCNYTCIIVRAYGTFNFALIVLTIGNDHYVRNVLICSLV